MSKLDRRVARRKATFPVWSDARWFEVVDRFDPAAIRAIPRTAKDERMFILGPIEDIIIIEVPQNAPVERVQEVLRVFEERGIRVLAFTDNTRFVKLRMCSPQEQEMLNARDSETGNTGVLASVRAEP